MATTADRRIERTRSSVLAAFRALLFERGYDAISVREVIERANVGRSTFYEHFANKEEALYATLEPVMTPLADVLSGDTSRLPFALEHIWATKTATAAMFAGPARPVIERFLADLLERRLAARRRRHGGPVLLPPRTAAAFLADLQLSLIARSLHGPDRCSAAVAQTALVATTNAAAAALFRP